MTTGLVLLALAVLGAAVGGVVIALVIYYVMSWLERT